MTHQVALHVAAGCSIPVACASVGVSWNTAQEWLAYHRQGKGSPWSDFAEAMEEAKAAFEAGAVGRINRAGVEDWKALAWLLERRIAKRWRPPPQRSEEQHNHSLEGLTPEQLLELVKGGGR